MVAADEIAAVVCDIGTSTVKAGYTGDDTPKVVFNTQTGINPSSMDIDSNTNSRKYKFAESAQIFSENLEIGHPLKDGMVNDWEMYAALLDYTLNSKLRVRPEETPIVTCEPSINTSDQRAKIAELIFEKMNCPAFFTARRGVLSAFATGKSTALVVDVGAGQTSVTPVYDGYVIKKSAVSSNVAGDFLSEEAFRVLESKKVNLSPHFKIMKKKAVDFGKPAEVTLKKLQGLTESFEKTVVMRIVEDFKETVCGLADIQYNESLLSARPQKTFEFPSGYNGNFGVERFRIPEILFNPKVGTFQEIPDADFNGIPAMIQNALNSVDVDVRPFLLSNIVVVGGSSGFANFADRLNNDLVRYFPGSKIRLYSPGSTAERRFSSWIGGSILSSLGTFQQLWISKQEYEEHGGSIVDKRCS